MYILESESLLEEIQIFGGSCFEFCKLGGGRIIRVVPFRQREQYTYSILSLFMIVFSLLFLYASLWHTHKYNFKYARHNTDGKI